MKQRFGHIDITSTSPRDFTQQLFERLSGAQKVIHCQCLASTGDKDFWIVYFENTDYLN